MKKDKENPFKPFMKGEDMKKKAVKGGKKPAKKVSYKK